MKLAGASGGIGGACLGFPSTCSCQLAVASLALRGYHRVGVVEDRPGGRETELMLEATLSEPPGRVPR